MESTKTPLSEKLELIQDIINSKKILYGFGNILEITAVKNPEVLFDLYYDQSNEDLTLIWSVTQAELSAKARELANL